MKVNVFGHVNGVRGFVGGLAENDVDVSLVPLDNRIPQKPSGVLADALMREFDFDSPSICISAPTNFNRFYGAKRIGYATWETSRLPNELTSILNRMDDIWTVSNFSKKVFLDSGVDKDVKVVPAGVDTTVFNPYVEKMRTPNQDVFIFFSTFEWERRNGPDVLLRAYAEEFEDGDNVGLVLQTHNSFLQEFNPYEKIFQMNLGKMPLVVVLKPAETEFDVARRNVSADCFVLPTRGESRGVQIMEAMACGLPVITTNWGGHLDYTNKDCGWLIDVEDMEVPNDEPFWKPYDGNQWANPSVKHLRELMRYAYEHKDECTKKGFDAYKHVDKNYSWKKSTSIVKELLKK